MTVRDRVKAAGWSFWIPLVFSVLAVVGAVVTAINPQWIETLFDTSPDNGSGASEWELAAVFATVAVVSIAVTSWRWRAIEPAVS
jgi:uncharacterized membrane protein YcjF (UPF0283 family)